VVNYDLPWNPQRIEQRIGRCHRYGQEFDVVVVNFLNKKNAADKRVYDLLAEKFKLFSGVFGASDEVLGAIESGVDFEKRIASIYQKCRTPEQIQFEFDQLQTDLETEISTGQRDAREKLLDNFDQEVVERVRVDSRDILNRFNEQLWRLSKHLLSEFADFDDDGYSFTLHSNPFPGEKIHPGPYRLGKAVEDANTFRVGHPLAQRVIDRGKNLVLPPVEVNFRYGGSGKRMAALEPLVGKSGWLTCTHFTVAALETEDLISFSAVTDSGETVDEIQCRRFFDLPAKLGSECEMSSHTEETLASLQAMHRASIFDETNRRNGQWFETEIEKLDRWAEDRRSSLKAVLAELDEVLKDAKKEARLAPTLPEKLERQRATRALETKREEAWRNYETASREIDQQKDRLLDEVSLRMELQIAQTELFTLRWQLT
jgi:hypothetical protein